jgi:peptidyl-prolyl cis-trans isomerase B (cyclophilin B)
MAKPPETEIDADTLYTVTLTTDKGPIVLDLDPGLAPRTVNNFVALARQGFYDGLIFHRVEPGFVIQGGDPDGTGRGGPGYKFEDEPVKGDYVAGAVAMANAGPDTNGSQFFICLNDLGGRLAKSYNLFGHVTEGMEIVHAIKRGDSFSTVTVTERPRTP